MKRLLLVPVLALTLAGCGTTGSGPSADEIKATVEKVRSITAQVCKFVPTVTTVSRIIATFTGAGALVDIAGQTAAEICAAVTTAPLADGGTRRVVVRGVVVKGTKLR